MSRRVAKGRTLLLATSISQKHCGLGKARITEQTLSDLFPAGWEAASGYRQVLEWITLPWTSHGAVSITPVLSSQQWGLIGSPTSTFLSLQPVALGCNLFEGRPQLTAWRVRVEEFLGADLCQQARGPILSIQKRAAKNELPVPSPEVQSRMMLRIARIP